MTNFSVVCTHVPPFCMRAVIKTQRVRHFHVTPFIYLFIFSFLSVFFKIFTVLTGCVMTNPQTRNSFKLSLSLSPSTQTQKFSFLFWHLRVWAHGPVLFLRRRHSAAAHPPPLQPSALGTVAFLTNVVVVSFFAPTTFWFRFVLGFLSPTTTHFQSRTMPRRNLIKTNKYKTEIPWLPKRKTTTTRDED